MKSTRLHYYLAIILGTILSSITGYYSYYYISNIVPTVLITAVIAIILTKLFDLAFTQLKQSNQSGVQYHFAKVTEQGIKQLQTRINAALPDAKLYVLHWPSKNYINLDGGQFFTAKHSLVYASQRFHQVIHTNDHKFFSQLPEVVALDITSLLKQFNYNTVVPLWSGDEVFGLIFTNQFETKNEVVELVKYTTVTLGQFLQHDAIVIGEQREVHGAEQNNAIPWQAIVVMIAFILLTCFWLATPFIKEYMHQNYLFEFANVYGLVAVWGGIWGMIIARQFRVQTNLRRALIMFSVGLLLQEFGQLSYATYYTVWNIQVPYPSVGDVGFFGSALAYIVGVLFLAKASGVDIKLKNFKNQLLAALIPCFALLIGYLLFLQHYQIDWQQPLKVFLDFGYPFVQAVYVSAAILIYLLSVDTAGQSKKQVFYITVALFWQFICDYTFLFQASRGTWEMNGVNDYMYLISYAFMTFTIINFFQFTDREK